MAHVGEWIASLARGLMILTVAMSVLVAYGAGSLRRLAIRDPAARRRHRARQRGRLMRWAFTRLGATFIKVGQIMSSRPDLFSPDVIDELRWLQDHVPPFAFHRIRRILERELGASSHATFRELSPTPVAAGSVAQVHHGVLSSGEEVAVKVLRPGVIARVRRDGRIMLWVAHLAHTCSRRARTADVVGHVRNLVAGILAQTDLRRESNHYERFRRNFEGTAGLRFPRVYRRHSSRMVLTMEFIHGTRIEDTDLAHLPHAARVLREAFFAMCFDHGFVHADLHPGNVLIREDGEVVLIDVGMVKQLSPGLLAQVIDFARCLAGGDAPALVAHLRQYHRYLEGTDWEAVGIDATAFIATLRARPIIELELSTVVGELFGLARKHRIRPLPEMTLVLLGMVTNEGMAKRLDPDVDTMAALARHLGPCVPRAAGVAPRRLARGSRSWPRAPLDSGRATIVAPPVAVARPHRPYRPGRPARLTSRITARLLAGRAGPGTAR